MKDSAIGTNRQRQCNTLGAAHTSQPGPNGLVCSTFVLICFTCAAITVATVILRVRIENAPFTTHFAANYQTVNHRGKKKKKKKGKRGATQDGKRSGIRTRANAPEGPTLSVSTRNTLDMPVAWWVSRTLLPVAHEGVPGRDGSLGAVACGGGCASCAFCAF